MDNISGIKKKAIKAEKAFWRDSKKKGTHNFFNYEFWEIRLKRDNLTYSFFENKVILEVGCGPFGMIYFIPNAKKRIGIDPLIDFYKYDLRFINETNNLLLFNTTGEKLDSIENCSIDIVIIYNVLDHTSKPDKVISEIYRILKKKGIIYVNSHIIRGILSPFRKYLKIFDPPHPYHFSREDILNLLKKNQFEIKSETLIKSKYDIVSFKTFLTRFFISNLTVLGKK